MSEGEKSPFLRIASNRSDDRRSLTFWRCPKCAKAGRESGPVMECFLEVYRENGTLRPEARRFACMTCFVSGILTFV